MQTFYSHGKLLLTAEYVVLDGAKALAVPTVYGQKLTLENISLPKILWTSFDNENKIWFEDTFKFEDINDTYTSRNAISDRLIQILKAAKQLNPDFLEQQQGLKINTLLDFPKNWGLGTSSTLINNIAQWAKVDPYKLLKLTFGGSGYDIACAQNDTAIHYQITQDKPTVNRVDFNPAFSDQLYFVHLNKKQNSRDGIAHYKANRHNIEEALQLVNKLTEDLQTCSNIENCITIIEKHEIIISQITKQTPVKEKLFKDFKGAVKSLGAWGGDFVLVASKTDPTDYFKSNGYTTILKYAQMVLT